MGRRTARISTLLGVVLAACASPMTQQTTMGDPEVITREEIDERVGSRSAYDLVRTLRPQWLQTRGITTLRQAVGDEGIVVYMDNARLGGVDVMRRVTLGSVQYLQFFTAREATQRWGGGHLHGAILISTASR